MPRLRLVPLLILTVAAATSVLARDFWSIDCGGTEPFVDENKLIWTDDAELAPLGGTPHTIPKATTTAAWLPSGPIPLPRELSTLRAFPSNATRRHCYTIAGIGSGRKILLRTTFFYGNYDGKSKPPTFRLILETEYWSPVRATMWNISAFEVIYTTTRNDTRVCVGRVYPGQDPFINSIEIRALPPEVYAGVTPSAKMWTLRRNSFGTNESVRYRYDKYDRIWRPARIGTAGGHLYQSVPTTRYWVDVSSTQNDPPERLFQTSISPLTTDTATLPVINISTVNLPSDPVPVYLILYFTEPANLTGTDAYRGFILMKDGEPWTSMSDPLFPPYGRAFAVDCNLRASSQTVFTIMPAGDGSLPPVLSALELFLITDVRPTMGTDVNDVRGLEQLQSQFQLLQEWTGDPCLPKVYAWEWVGCSLTSPPRITDLFLGGFGLSGHIPDLSSFDAIITIDLHNNNFTGVIPEYVADLPGLRFLNLADNNVTRMPASLSHTESLVMVNVTGNPMLCTSTETCVSAISVFSDPESHGASQAQSQTVQPLVSSHGGLVDIEMHLFFTWLVFLGVVT